MSWSDALRADADDPDLKVVLLVDSVEQLRGNGEDAAKVQQSVVELFNGQAASLALPRLHVVDHWCRISGRSAI